MATLVTGKVLFNHAVLQKNAKARFITCLHLKNYFSSGTGKKVDYFGDEKWSPTLASFASKKSQVLEWHKYSPLKMSKFKFNQWKEKVKRDADLLGQKYIPNRQRILGCDLAAAHFIVYRGGKIRFQGNDKWFKIDEGEEHCDDLPSKLVKGMYVEAIDAEKMQLRYEGLVNMENLRELKWISFNGCPYIDDWCVDRVSGMFQDSLEYLDLSNCLNITEGVISCLYRLKNLKTLKLENIVNTRTFEYSCLLLEDYFPQLTVEGVTFLEIKE